MNTRTIVVKKYTTRLYIDEFHDNLVSKVVITPALLQLNGVTQKKCRDNNM